MAYTYDWSFTGRAGGPPYDLSNADNWEFGTGILDETGGSFTPADDQPGTVPPEGAVVFVATSDTQLFTGTLSVGTFSGGGTFTGATIKVAGEVYGGIDAEDGTTFDAAQATQLSISAGNGGRVTAASAYDGVTVHGGGTVDVQTIRNDTIESNPHVMSYTGTQVQKGGTLTVKDVVSTSNRGISWAVEGTATISGSFAVDPAKDPGFASSSGLGIRNGGTVDATSATITIAAHTWSSDGVSVSGAGSKLLYAAKTLTVGQKGNGFFSVDDGAVQSLQSVVVAQESTSGRNPYVQAIVSSSKIQVYGAGSNLSIAGNATVADAGVGGFTIQDGNAAATVGGQLIVARKAGSEGSVGVGLSGGHETLKVAGQTFVGVAGKGQLTVSGGGAATVSDLVLGAETKGLGRIYMDGVGSKLSVASKAVIGQAATGNATQAGGGLELHGGAVFDASKAAVTFAAAKGSTASFLIEGDKTKLLVKTLTVGAAGAAGDGVSSGTAKALANAKAAEPPHTVSNGALVQAGTFEIGAKAGGTGETLVTGVSFLDKTKKSELISFNSTLIGGNGKGTLTIEKGAKATLADTVVGGKGGQGNIKVDGDGSTLNTSRGLVLGSSGDGALTFRNGSNGDLGGPVVLGAEKGAKGQILASGAGTEIEARGEVVIGKSATGGIAPNGGQLSLVNGAQFSAEKTVTLAKEAGATGSLLISGKDSGFAGTKLVIGDKGSAVAHSVFAGPSVSGGAELRVAQLVLGASKSGNGHLTVSGKNTEAHAALNADIGEAGRGGIDVSAGGELTARVLNVGRAAGGTGVLRAAGKDTKVNASDGLVLGVGGTGTVEVTDDAKLKTAAIVVGSAGAGKATLVVSDGGFAEASSAIIHKNAHVSVEKSGTLQITSDKGKGLSGDGTIEIGAKGILILGVPDRTVDVAFAGKAGRLFLDGDFAASIRGFAPTDTINVTGFVPAPSQTTLAVKAAGADTLVQFLVKGKSVGSLSLEGHYTKAGLHLSAQGKLTTSSAKAKAVQDDGHTQPAAAETGRGGTTSDNFVFHALGDGSTRLLDHGTIQGFGSGDRIDLSALDADDMVAGDQAAAFIGSEASHGGAGALRVATGKSDTHVLPDTDGRADFALHLDAVRLAQTDFLL